MSSTPLYHCTVCDDEMDVPNCATCGTTDNTVTNWMCDPREVAAEILRAALADPDGDLGDAGDGILAAAIERALSVLERKDRTVYIHALEEIENIATEPRLSIVERFDRMRDVARKALPV